MKPKPKIEAHIGDSVLISGGSEFAGCIGTVNDVAPTAVLVMVLQDKVYTWVSIKDLAVVLS